jgi:hypothetical protein
MEVRTHVRFLIVLFVAVFLAHTLQAQIPVPDLQAVEGPWECRNSMGTAGVFITAETFWSQQNGGQGIASQLISILVYQRQGGQEQGGYFSTSDGSTVFDGKRMIIHFKDRTDIPPLDLDVRFDQASQRWMGSFSLCDESQEVLDRPRARDGPHSAFVGDWQDGLAGALHIRQDYDGGLTAWRDSTLSGLIHADQRSVLRLLYVTSATQSTIVIETVTASGTRYGYKGTLSSDGQQLSGQWRGDGGGMLNVPTLYRRYLINP